MQPFSSLTRALAAEDGDLPRTTFDCDGGPEVARFIEYGGSLQTLECPETLIECRRRPGGKPCLGSCGSQDRTGAINALCRSA